MGRYSRYGCRQGQWRRGASNRFDCGRGAVGRVEETGGSRDRVVLLWIFWWFKSGGRDLVWGMIGADGDGG